ncbi:N-acyl homoserine lactonase family protein [Chloroflexota bacterium]
MFARSLYVLYCGSILSDKGNVLTYRLDVGKKVEIAISAYLIKTEEGNILFDTGVDHDDFPYLQSIGKELKVRKEDHLLTRLQATEVSPEEINFVFQSHLHWDHCGLLKHFPEARIIVQRQEYGYAINPPPFAEALYRCQYYDSPELNWQIIDGDESLMPGVTAIFTPGHTPGHQSLMVELPESGTLILSGDCAYISENLEREIIPGIFVSPFQALHSLKKLKNLSRITNGQIFYNHSMEQIKTLKKPPEFYR